MLCFAGSKFVSGSRSRIVAMTDREALRLRVEGMREVDRVTSAEYANRSFSERWEDRNRVQALLSLMPNRPREDADGPRARWTLLKDRWLERRN